MNGINRIGFNIPPKAIFRRGWLQPSSFTLPLQPFNRLRMSGDAHPYPQQHSP